MSTPAAADTSRSSSTVPSGTTAPSVPSVPPAGDAVRPLPPGRSSGAGLGRAAWRALSPLVVSAVVAVLIWYGFLKAFSISPLVGKTPQAVWQYLFSGADAAAHRAAVRSPMLATLSDAGVGFVSGMVAAIVVGGLFVSLRSVEQTLMPVAMLLRSVPLVAMTPLIVLIFHRGLGAVAVMGGIVVFFPALVNTVQGLRSVPEQTRDLVHAYGGSDLAVLRRVGIPSALPAVFAAARISVPGSLTGALVVEWLATGKGIGSSMLAAIGGFDYDQLWADMAVLTAVSVVLYTVVGVLETAVLARYAPHRVSR
jgi:ABC-type nitrate/sulfonate/bicarbonate transport system permease component